MNQSTYTRLTFADREEISRGIWANESFADIGRRIDRSTSTITKEIHATVRYMRTYRAEKGQTRAVALRKQCGRRKKLDAYSCLRNYVYARLSNDQWSPEEIAKRIVLAYPQDKTMRISHETIYQHLYCLPRGELKAELMRNLRQERKMRQPRKYAHEKRQTIKDIISISERPEEVADRTVPGHWEGDLIMGKDHASALGTLVERTTRLTLLVPLVEKDAASVGKAFAKAFERIPAEFKKTLTYDRGTEMAQHKLFTKETHIKVYFADPHSPWQRGTNENTNGLIRQYFPKGTDFQTVSPAMIRKVERLLNTRPRKALAFYTPSETFCSLITGRPVAVES